ncbi:ABC transporter permease [Actinoplanes ianthinogenes]|uniref:ABC transporter permease n=1 Tax=Actinoplanes ianthinogenes TaxID=122358 RepID=A0ABM7M7L9_9ACTN|nr:ABC transporter permease [Actinoplanes ianthinogenes]BCJ47613.1 ABC transporter permease [Actinoplanes ianthinogenes]GGR02936.1 ABC transporter permease [Actinoplanes ianthinogenes]
MRAVRAEWSKLWSVRSTWITLGAAVALTVGLGLADTISTVRGWATVPAADRAAFDPLGSAFAGLTFAQLAFGVLGVLAVTSEYSSGTIVAALTAQPRRAVLFAAKAATVFGVSLIAGEALAFGSYLLGQAVLHGEHLDVGLGAPGVLRSVAGAGLYLCVVTMVGLGLGAFLRHPAGATSALIAVVFLAYGAAKAVEGWSYLPSRLLLSNAGDVVAQVHAVAAKPRLPSLGLAYLDLAMYLAVAVGLGLWRSTRDV